MEQSERTLPRPKKIHVKLSSFSPINNAFLIPMTATVLWTLTPRRHLHPNKHDGQKFICIKTKDIGPTVKFLSINNIRFMKSYQSGCYCHTNYYQLYQQRLEQRQEILYCILYCREEQFLGTKNYNFLLFNNPKIFGVFVRCL